MLETLSLIVILLEVVNAGSEEEPNAMCKVKVNLTCSAQDQSQLVSLNTLKLRVQVKTAYLGDEKF